MPNEMKYTGDHNEICQIRKFCRSRATLDSVLQNGAVKQKFVIFRLLPTLNTEYSSTINYNILSGRVV